jgi:hypothetical protein
MIAINSQWRSVTDREKWAARGASLVAKAKATKVVWFPPKPVETGKKTASTAKKATKKATDATKKTTNGTKNVTNPVRRTQT